MRWMIAAVAALLCANSAAAHDLVMVANITDSPTVFGSILLDAGSVRANGEHRLFWSYIFARDGDDFTRGVNYTEVDCGKQTIRYVKRQMFDAGHHQIGEMDKPTSWSRAPKESAELRMVRLVCGTEKPTEAESLGDMDPLTISDALLTDAKLR